jgi:dihydroorotase/N-acyl-D-amino-acid deacylase
MFDLLLTGGDVVDGTGRPAFRADVGIAAGKLEAVGDLADAEAGQVLACRGLVVSPGWVDIHGHADWTVLDYCTALNLLIQGCTTTVAGNCGMAPAPMQGPARELLRQQRLDGTATLRALQQRFPDLTWGFGDYLDEVEGHPLGVNYVQLAGHSALRAAVMGHEARPASPAEIAGMCRLLEECLDAGARGLSSGLVFIPACWSQEDELIALCRVVAGRRLVYTSHIRGERETNMEATEEFLRVAEAAGVRAHMSHMQSKYPIYGNAVPKLELLEAAREHGVDVSCDSESFPDWPTEPARFLQIYSYTAEQLASLLRSREGRAEVKQRMRTVDPYHPLGRFGPGGVPYRRAWDRVIIFDCPHNRSLEGRTVAAVAAHRGVDSEDALFDLALAEGGSGPLMIYDYIEDDHFRTAAWPYCIFPSVDTGLYDPATLGAAMLRAWKETRFPGTLGLFPRVLGQFVREEKLLTLEEAVRKMTSFAMSRLGIRDRGEIAAGKWADITVFDPETIALRGARPDPGKVETFYPTGIAYVLVNGQVAVKEGKLVRGDAGRLIRG